MTTGANHLTCIKIVAAIVLVLAFTVLLAAGYDLRGLLDSTMDALRRAGPLAFFACMAFLPAVGVPITFFSFTAGSVFGPRLGMPMVMVAALAAIGFNMALSFVLARHGLRPLLRRLMKKMNITLPDVQPREEVSVIVLLRATPGIPFPLQNYLLGMTAVAFSRYLVISCLIAFPLNAALIILGESVLRGQGGAAVIGLLLLVAALAGVQLARRRYQAGASGAR